MWRTLELEGATRALEFARAEAVAARVLTRATGSPEVFAAAGGVRFAIRGDRVVVDEELGWLDPPTDVANPDPVVQDRLERAARSEFVDRDAAAAARGFDEILAAGLPIGVRLEVLAAAAWQARRADLGERERRFVSEFADLVQQLEPAAFSHAATATAVASMLRLVPPADRTPELLAPVRWLPAATLLPADVEDRARRAVAQRRVGIREARSAWRERAPRRDGGVHGIGDTAAAGRLLWWQPRADGGSDVQWLAPAEFVAAVTEVAGTGTLPAWPFFVEPRLHDDPRAGFGGVPFVAGVEPAEGLAVAQRTWLLPTLTLVLLLAFGLVVVQQLRAGRREAAAVRAQAEFLTTVTHELKTPLASIRLLGEMLAEGRAAGREAEYYRMLASESGRLSMLIENVLDLGRVERGERAYDLRDCDVAEVVHETVTMLEPLAERASSAIEYRGPEPGGGAIVTRIDRSALVQALICVLDNARKYGAGPIVVDLASDAGQPVVITVRDHGAGVPSADRERIFDRFARGSAHAHGATPGVGIGLYLARGIARRLGGDLVCSAPTDGGPGASFTFTLPPGRKEIAA